MNDSWLNKQTLQYPLLGLIGIWFAANMLSFPQEALNAALKGFAIWWDVLFPALFPFLVISEIMLGFGFVHFIGTLLDPMMRPLFRVPGIGGFVMAMGFASGYPVAAKLTAQLREQQLVNRVEGERLVAFTTTSDPIFLIGAVSIGFFQHAGLAVILAAAHYGAAVALGLLMRYHGDPHDQTQSSGKQLHRITSHELRRPSLVLRAFNEMHQARLKDARNTGQILQDAIRSSLSLIFVIGGLVVFFSVFMTMMQAAGILALFHSLTASLLGVFGLSTQLSEAVISGVFEVTIGAQAAGLASENILRHSASVAVFILSWGGLSVHAQVLSLISRTRMRYMPFLAARMIHAIMSAILVFIIWPWLYPYVERKEALLPAFGYGDPVNTVIFSLQTSALLFFLVIVLIPVCFSIYQGLTSLRSWWKH